MPLVIMLSVDMLCVLKLNVIFLCVVMQNVVAPLKNVERFPSEASLADLMFFCDAEACRSLQGPHIGTDIRRIYTSDLTARFCIAISRCVFALRFHKLCNIFYRLICTYNYSAQMNFTMIFGKKNNL
jgi:hypothetical protein